MTTPNDPSSKFPQEPFSDANAADDMDLSAVHGSILREHSEPGVGNEPVPIWLVMVFFAIVFWGGLYLAYNSGGFRSDIYNTANVNWSGGGGGAAAAPDPKVIGKRLFMANCVVCHQASGQGVAGQFPPLVQSEWVLSQDWHGDNHLVKIVLAGLQGPVTVGGTQYNNAMPPWNHLKDDQIAAILTYIRSEWGNNGAPIPVDYVKKVREQASGRTDPWTEKELKATGRELISEAASQPAAAPNNAASQPAPPST